MALVHLVQHAEKEPLPGDPGLTALGRDQAAQVAQWLSGQGLRTVYSSPLRRARQTAEPISVATRLAVVVDDRLTERCNWNGQPIAEFLEGWQRTVLDRDHVPPGGQSSRQAAARLIAFLDGLGGVPGPVAAVTHGGVITDLLRTLLGDDALPPGLIDSGVPPCAITTLDGRTVLGVAQTV